MRLLTDFFLDFAPNSCFFSLFASLPEKLAQYKGFWCLFCLFPAFSGLGPLPSLCFFPAFSGPGIFWALVSGFFRACLFEASEPRPAFWASGPLLGLVWVSGPLSILFWVLGLGLRTFAHFGPLSNLFWASGLF